MTCSPAHGDHGIELAGLKVVEEVGGVAGDVHANLLHHRLR